MSADTSWFTSLIRDIADYPSPGVTFRDITPMLGDGPAFSRAVRELAERFESHSDAQRRLFDYIEVFYNGTRRHSAIGYQSPRAFERLAA